MYSAADLINSRFKEEGRLLGEQVVGSAACDKPCERDCFMKKDELHKVKFSSKSCIKNFESGWHLPKLEMIAYYAIPRYSSGAASVDLVAKDVFIHCDKICGKFSEPLELEIATWTPDLGNRWQVLWIERDYWDKVQDKFSLGFSVGFKVKDPVTGTETSVAANAAWEITSMKQDKEIGRSLVEYCDKALNEGETYKPCSCDASGGFWFKEHLKQ